MATLFFKMVCIVFCNVLTTLIIHDKCSAQPHDKLLEFQEKKKLRTFNGQRLASQEAKVFERDVLSNLQCLDICLRTEQCASVDIKETNSKKICRVNRASQEHFLEDKDNWSHINISAQYLRKILSSAVDECEGRETGEAASMTQTQAKLNDYCANVAPSVDSCSKKKKQGNCAGAWIARVHDSGWCCIDSSHPSKNCCCPIPQ
ncbi:uncharacterized protein LOC144664370 isoform X2 [Oculina patagonica]